MRVLKLFASCQCAGRFTKRHHLRSRMSTTSRVSVPRFITPTSRFSLSNQELFVPVANFAKSVRRQIDALPIPKTWPTPRECFLDSLIPELYCRRDLRGRPWKELHLVLNCVLWSWVPALHGRTTLNDITPIRPVIVDFTYGAIRNHARCLCTTEKTCAIPPQ